MLCEFQCFKCRHVKLEPDPLKISNDHVLCCACAKRGLPPEPPPMRGGVMQHAPSLTVTLVVLVFLMGVVVGTKMAGGW